MAAAQAAAEQSSGGLPQFDLAQWPGQMVWMLVIFAVLFVLFRYVFVPKIGGTIAAREDKIGGDIGQARRLLGYRPTHHLGQGLNEALEWYVKDFSARRKGAARGVKTAIPAR